ncbi:hypothetical protein K503DRAFT_869998 [Rhizopogon vinicolor AM-OR11-026]|uniref:Uncharacterized protein n=1 Tax=Rhizopogon vinicolor AM-OR11-026 TaxID=1314800 RepID=A0A1B7MJD7_9AGAM|nr:hypothetical protein K503DRAFT_869998 [Rhizopogon vinicolor AM-OR11-026]
MPRTASSPSSVSHSNISALYHLLWWQQERSIIKRGLCYNVEDLEDHDQVHPFTCDTLDLSQYPSAKLPNGGTSMLIRSEYDLLFENVSKVKRNFVIHGSAGIGKSHFLAYILVMRLFARKPVTYQIDQSNTLVMCFTADGCFVLPQEARDRHPLFQRDDVWHLIDSMYEAPRTYQNTVHTRALMWSTCGKAIFTTFWPGGLDFKIEWPGCGAPIRRWMKPCTWKEIYVMSALTAGDQDVDFLRQAYVHFGSNAYICLRVAQLPSRTDHYLNVLEDAHDHYWTLDSLIREPESQCSRSLFAVQPPGDTRTEPISYPVSQFASRLLADRIISSDPSSAIETVDKLLSSIDTREAGEAFYRHAVIALMSKFGGTFELRRPDWQGHCESALENFVLRAQDAAYKDKQVPPLIYTYYTQEQLLVLAKKYPYTLLSPHHALMHPGIDAIVFDARNSTVWLMQVTYEFPRLISPKGLLFLLTAVRGSAYEPSPLRPWKLIVATRGQPTPYPFKLSGSRENQHYYFQFWDPRIKSYLMHLRDTDRDLNSSSSPYEQWGFPYKTARKNLNRLMRHLASWLGHGVCVPRRATGTKRADQAKAEHWSTVTRASGVPGAELLADMISQQPVGSTGFYMRI